MRVTRAKTTFVLVVVALGSTLGAAFCALAFTHLVIATPLPYPEQDRLVVAEQVTFDQRGQPQGREFSYPAIVALHDAAEGVFSSSVIIDNARDVIVSHPAQPLVAVSYASPEFADLFDPPMALGRFPSVRDDPEGKRPVAVISHAAWQSLFDLREDVLGSSVRTASGIDFEVVGVTAPSFVEPGFHGPGQRTAVWLPWKFMPSTAQWGWAATTGSLALAGRLLPAVSERQAADRLSVLLDRRWREELGAAGGSRARWSTRVELTQAQRAVAGAAVSVGPLLLAGTLGLVLVTLLNVIHVLVARVAERAREFSIQAALGATNRHVFEAVFADTLVLMMSAAIVGLLVAAAGFSVMQHFLGSLLPRVDELVLGWRLVVVAMVSAIALAAIVAAIAIAPVRRLSANVVLNAGRHGTAPKVSRRLRTALVAIQVAVAGLLVAANCGLFREAYGVLSEHGIALERSANVFLYQSAASPLDETALAEQLGQLRRRLADLPAVAKVSQSHSPLQDFIKSSVLSTRTDTPYPVEVKRIDHEYFGLTGQPLAAGRNFDATDIRHAAPVAVVNVELARILDREGGALGASLTRAGEAPRTVIGVVNELAYPGQPAATPRIYFPASEAGASFILSFEPGARMSRQELVEFVAGVNPNFGVFLYDDLDRQRADILGPRRITAISTLLIALIVSVVSGMGLYGVLSYGVRLTRAEIGTRLAFGARPRHIVQLLVVDNLSAVACGSVVGAAIALFALPRLNAALDGVRWQDATTAAAVLALLTLCACYLSARPLLTQSPAVALRDAGR